jgi:hypothetical protein
MPFPPEYLPTSDDLAFRGATKPHVMAILAEENYATTPGVQSLIAASQAAMTASTDAAIAAAAADAMSYHGRSARFPYGNRTNGDSSPFAMIAQPTANIGTLFNADGTLLVTVTVPRERLRASTSGQSNISRMILGNVMSGSAPNNFFLSLTGVSGTFMSQLTFYMRSTLSPLIGPVNFALPESFGTRLLIALRRSGTSFMIDVWDCDTGVKNAGPVIDATTFTGLTPASLGSFFQIGAGGTTNVSPQVPTFNPLQTRCWDGDIGFVGYNNAALGDAACQAIAMGAAIEAATLPESWRWARELDGEAASLQKPAWAVGDATLPAQVVAQGGLEIKRGSNITAKGTHFTVDRKVAGDAHVDAVIPGQSCKAVLLSGKLRTTLPAADVIECRFLTPDGDVVVPWQRIAAVAPGSTTWSGFANVPKGPVPYVRQLRLLSQKADPSKWVVDATRFGVGYRIMIIGQSQVANLRSRTRGLVYTGRTRFSWIEQATETATSYGAINTFVVHERLPAIGDGVFGIMQAIDRAGCDAVVALEIQAVGGTSALDLIKDSLTVRSWNPMLRSSEVMDGDRSCIIWNWDPADIATNYATLLDAVFCGTGAQAGDHFMFGPKSDGGTQVGASVVYMPTQRTNGYGTTEGDFDNNGTYGTRRDEGVAWALSKPFAKLGIAPLDLELQDALHPSMSLASGTERHGQHLGLSALRGIANDASANPTISAASFAFTDATRTAFRFDVSLPNCGMLRNGLGATWNAGADKAVRLIEVSTDGITWSKSGFAAALSGPARVTVTKAVDAWAAPAAATGTVTFSGVGVEGDTIRIGTTTFTLSAFGDGANEVQIGATATATAQAFRDRVNGLSATLGVTASGTGAVITLAATALSPAANATALVKTGSAITVSGATLTGGAGLLVRVGWGGFGSYGDPSGVGAVTAGNVAARDYWLYDGYERHVNGRGIPVLPSNAVYTVTG